MNYSAKGITVNRVYCKITPRVDIGAGAGAAKPPTNLQVTLVGIKGNQFAANPTPELLVVYLNQRIRCARLVLEM